MRDTVVLISIHKVRLIPIVEPAYKDMLWPYLIRIGETFLELRLSHKSDPLRTGILIVRFSDRCLNYSD
jgi:hypothetical protein